MRALECKIPPPVLAAIVAGGMWGLARVTPSFGMAGSVNQGLASALALTGCAIAVAAVLSFRQARTTIHPTHPERTSALVTSGVYRLTRNPMYLGILCALLAWAAYLANAWTLSGPVVFVLYINRFQIVPEERALSALFGADYADYCRRVRRWL